MNSIARHLFRSELIFSMLSGLVLWLAMGISSYFVILFVLAAGMVFIASQKFIYGLSIFIFLLPFTGMKVFDANFASLPGVKTLQLLTLFVIALAFMKYNRAEKLSRDVQWFAAFFVMIFALAAFRSLGFLDTFNLYQEDKLSAMRFILTHLVKPLIYFVPFILIIKFTRDARLFRMTFQVISGALVALSLVILYLYLFQIEDKGNVDAVNAYYEMFFGMHRNDLANFFIIGIPFLLAQYFQRKSFLNMLGIGIAVAATGFTYSRTAYVIVLFSFIFYLVISRRTRFLPVFLVIAFALSFFISSNIIERASYGLETNDRNAISAGRIDDMWLPLIEEYIQNPGKLLLGGGRYSIVASDANRHGLIYYAGHPHNMFLEFIFDAGLLSLAVVLVFFYRLIRSMFARQRSMEDSPFREYGFALIVGIIAYLVAGLSGRSIFPQLLSSFFWIAAGLAVVMLKLTDLSEEDHHESA